MPSKRNAIVRLSIAALTTLLMLFVLVACIRTSSEPTTMEEKYGAPGIPPESAVLLETWRHAYDNQPISKQIEAFYGQGVKPSTLVSLANQWAQPFKEGEKSLDNACEDPVYDVTDEQVMINLTDNYTGSILWTTNMNFSTIVTFTLPQSSGIERTAYVGCYRPYWKFDLANMIGPELKAEAEIAATEVISKGFFIPDTVGYPYFCFPIETAAGSIGISNPPGGGTDLQGNPPANQVYTADFPGSAYLWCPFSIAWALADYPFKSLDNSRNVTPEQRIEELGKVALQSSPELQTAMLEGLRATIANMIEMDLIEPTPETFERLFPYLDDAQFRTFNLDSLRLPTPGTDIALPEYSLVPDIVEGANELLTKEDLWKVGNWLMNGLEFAAGAIQLIGGPSIYGTFGMGDVADIGGTPVDRPPLSSIASTQAEGVLAATAENKQAASLAFKRALEASAQEAEAYRNAIMIKLTSMLPHAIGVAAITGVDQIAGTLPILEYIPVCTETRCAEGYRFGVVLANGETQFTLYQSLIQAGVADQYDHFTPKAENTGCILPVEGDTSANGEAVVDEGEMVEMSATPTPMEAAPEITSIDCEMSTFRLDEENPLFVMGDLGDWDHALNNNAICGGGPGGFARFTSLYYDFGSRMVQSCSGDLIEGKQVISGVVGEVLDPRTRIDLWMGPASIYYGYSPSTGDFFDGTLQFIWFDPDQGTGS